MPNASVLRSGNCCEQVWKQRPDVNQSGKRRKASLTRFCLGRQVKVPVSFLRTPSAKGLHFMSTPSPAKPEETGSGIGHKLMRSSALRGVSFVVQAVVSLLMTPLIVHSLGERTYGFWTLVGTFVGYYGIMDMGVSSAVSRYVSQSLGKRDEAQINRVVSTAFFLFCVVAIVVLAVTGVAASLVFGVVKDPAEFHTVRLLLLVLGVRVALSFPARVFAGVLNAHLRYDLTACATIAQLVMGNAAIYMLLRGGGGVIGMSLILLGAGAIEYLLNLVCALRVFPQLRLSWGFAERQTLVTIFRYSWKTLAAQVALIFRSKASGFIVAAFLGVNLVTYYSIAARLLEYFAELVYSLIGNLAPVFSRYEGEGKPELIRSRFLLFTKFSVVLTVFVGASIIFYGRAFIACWMGAGFERSYWVVVILTVPAVLSLMQTPASCLLFGVSKHQYIALIASIDGVLNFTAGMALAPVLGIYGVAMGMSVGTVLTSLTLYPFFVCRELKIPLPRYYINTLLVPALLSLVPLLGYFFLFRRVLQPGYGSLFALAALQSVLFGPVAFFLVLTAAERSVLLNSVYSFLPRKDLPLP